MTNAPAGVTYQPSATELQMLGALLLQSIRDAWLLGEDRVRFRGYCIEARRVETRAMDARRIDSGAGGGHPQLMLTLRIAGAPGVLDRMFIAVAPYPIPGAGCDIRLQPVRQMPQQRIESPVGCVSPIDVRNASPETGHVS